MEKDELPNYFIMDPSLNFFEGYYLCYNSLFFDKEYY